MMQMGIFRYIPDFGRDEANIAHHILPICLSPNSLASRLHEAMIEEHKKQGSHHQRDSK